MGGLKATEARNWGGNMVLASCARLSAFLLLAGLFAVSLPGCDDDDSDSKDAEPENALRCHAVGTAAQVLGRCACSEGYVGDLCDRCAQGWKAASEAGVCLPDCGKHGSNRPEWKSGSGSPACKCDEGYAGDFCRDCAPGFQDNDKDGVCEISCEQAQLNCEENAVCSDAQGKAACTPIPQADPLIPDPVTDPIADWTYMVFLNGDNDLGYTEIDYSDAGYPVIVTTDYAGEDLLEILDGLKAAQLRGAEPGRINVLVLFDESKDSPDPSTRVYRLTAESGIELVDTGDAIFAGNEADMSAAKTLQNFGVWAISHYPAKHYGLDLWDHGGSWNASEGASGKGGKLCAGRGRLFACVHELPPKALQKVSPNKPGVRFSVDETDGILPDGYSQRQITFADGVFAGAMDAIVGQAGRKLDIVSFDACALAQMEIVAEVAPYADYLVASEDTVSGLGFSYDTIFEALAFNPSLPPQEIGKIYADSYVERTEFMNNGKVHTNATMTLFELSAMKAFTEALDAFGKTLADASDDADYRASLAEALASSWRHAVYEMPDLWSLALQVKAAANAGALPSAVSETADALIAALDALILHHAIYSEPVHWGYTHEETHGLLFFFPSSVDCQYYAKLPDYAYLYEEPYISQYGDDYTYSMEPCMYYPNASENGSGSFSRTDVKGYIEASVRWSAGWGAFLKKYLGF